MKSNNNNNNTSNRVKGDGDFWNDVFDHPYKKNINEEASPFEVKASNKKRLIKFETFLIKHGQQPINIIEEKSKRLVANVNKMLSVAKMKEENRKRSQEQAYKSKEVAEVNQCTFAPKINKPHNSSNTINSLNTKDKDRDKVIKSSNKISVYERNVLWSNNLKGKKARQKQTKELTNLECSFRPNINDNRLDHVFNNNKLQTDSHPYQNVYFLKTQATNQKKRRTSFDYSIPQSTEKRTEPKSFSIKNLNESITALRSELRNYNEIEDDL